jgi:hypothetical protein
MEKLREELKSIHIEVTDDEEKENFNFNFKMPPMSPMPDSEHEYAYSFKHRSNPNIPDSFKTREHVIIRARKGEERPVFLKEITGKNGEKYYIFKRKLPKESAERKTELKSLKGKSSLGFTDVRVYPNPSSGEINIRFNSSVEADVTVRITDEKGKEVYTHKKTGHKGEYNEAADLSSKAKGVYYVTITNGEDSVTKKVVVE